MHEYRTHTCGALRLADAGQSARLSGWVHRKRDHGQLLFIDLRDHYGVTQCVIDVSSPLFAAADALRLESVITVTGKIVARSDDTINPNLPTGEVELVIAELAVQSVAEPLPLPVNSDADYPEDIRLTYRFLDLRREHVHAHIMLRSHVIASIRRRMIEQGFTEFQTPILTADSPEGARPYYVPSRLHPGQFYALPQAPQVFKQLLMVAGFDRYFQIAPCFRDEASRADRAPGEFYQLDFEMSFVTQEDVFAAIEPVLHGVFEEFADGRAVSSAPFRRIPYAEAILKYGTDKPDLRNSIVIADVTQDFSEDRVTFGAFKPTITKGGVVRVLRGQGAADKPRSFFDKLQQWARDDLSMPGLAYIVLAPIDPDDAPAILKGQEGSVEYSLHNPYHGSKFLPLGPLARHIPLDVIASMAQKAGADAGDVIFFVCDLPGPAAKSAGVVRTKLGEELGLSAKDCFEFCWVTDFPMYEVNEETGKIDFSHNPFSMPQGGLEALETRDPLTINAFQYDIVCNGIELSSGAIRNHRPDIMYKAFAIAGYSKEEVEARFPGMLNAFKFGAPPHGGSAPGIDRIVMLLADTPNLREIVAFPMNQQAQDLLMQAPAPIPGERLKELHLRLDLPPVRGARS
jgi:aspartyl-tRNA synthetase